MRVREKMKKPCIREGTDIDGFNWTVSSQSKFKLAICPHCHNPLKVVSAYSGRTTAEVDIFWLSHRTQVRVIPFDTCLHRCICCAYTFTKEEWDSLEVR